jgi:hypothetical protein
MGLCGSSLAGNNKKMSAVGLLIVLLVAAGTAHGVIR